MLTILLLFGTPLILGGMGLGFAMFHSAAKRREREGARRSYERMMSDKLDIIRTAIAMGYASDDISDLDARLERLVGADKLASLLDVKQPSAPPITADMLDTDIDAEVARLPKVELE